MDAADEFISCSLGEEFESQKNSKNDEHKKEEPSRYKVVKRSVPAEQGEPPTKRIVAEARPPTPKSNSLKFVSINDAPWTLNKAYSENSTRRLHEEILDFVEYVSPRPSEHEARMEVVKMMEFVILQKYPDCTVKFLLAFLDFSLLQFLIVSCLFL